MDITLPKEMWSKIWSDLDFETLQKTCVLVCHGWFKDIRGDGRLSGQLNLKNAEMQEEEAKAILSKWKELRILRLSKNLDQVDLSKTHKFLKKVIVRNVPEGYQNAFLEILKDYPVTVNQICFDPQDKLNSIGLDNITVLSLHFKEIEKSEKPFEPIGVMKNLIRFEIHLGEVPRKQGFWPTFEGDDFESIFEPLFRGIGLSSDLEEVRLEFRLHQYFDDLILKYLSQITRLEIHDEEINASLDDLLWIPKFKKLKTLIIKDLNILPESEVQDNELFNNFLQNFCPMTNVKKLELSRTRIGSTGYNHVDPNANSTFLIKLSEIFPALHTLIIADEEKPHEIYWDWNISLLESVLNALGSIKNLIISGMSCELFIPDGFDEPMVKSAMQEALEIIEKKFPFDSTAMKISAVKYPNSNPANPTDGYNFTIIKEKDKGPYLKIDEKRGIKNM